MKLFTWQERFHYRSISKPHSLKGYPYLLWCLGQSVPWHYTAWTYDRNGYHLCKWMMWLGWSFFIRDCVIHKGGCETKKWPYGD